MMNGFMTFLETCLRGDWAERMGWTLLHSLWQIALVAGIYAAVVSMLKNCSASSRYMAGCVTLFAMLVLPMITYVSLPRDATPIVEVRAQQPPAIVLPDVELSELPVEQQPLTRPEAVALAPSIAPSEPMSVVPAVVRDTGTTIQAEESSSIKPWLLWSTTVWLMGVCLLALRPFWGWMHVRRLQRNGLSSFSEPVRQVCEDMIQRLLIRRAVRFAESALVEVPTVVGYLRPLVLLPSSAITGLSLSQIEMVLAHELAHVRRHDYLVNLAQTVIEALLFYHPGMWWVSSQIRSERENCCDDCVVALTGSRSRYVQALTRLEEQRSATPAAVLAVTGGSLQARVRRLLRDPKHELGNRNVTAWVTGLLTIIGLVAGTVAMQSQAELHGGIQGGIQDAGEVENADIGKAESLPEKLVQGVQVEASMKKTEWRIGDGAAYDYYGNVPVIEAIAKVVNTAAFEASGLADKSVADNPLAIEIDGKIYHDATFYSGIRPSGPWQRRHQTKLVLDERWIHNQSSRQDITSYEGPRLDLTPGKHTVRVLFTGLGQTPAPASRPFELEILPQQHNLQPWKHGWGNAVEGVRLSAVATSPKWQLGDDPTLQVRIHNAGERPWTFHNRPSEFGLEIDGQRYRNNYSYSTWRLALAPGDEYEITLKLDKSWKQGPFERRSGNSSVVLPGTPLSPFNPGQHTIRVFFTELCEPCRAEGQLPEEPAGQEITLEIVPPKGFPIAQVARPWENDVQKRIPGQWVSEALPGRHFVDVKPTKHTLHADGRYTREVADEGLQEGTWRLTSSVNYEGKLIFEVGGEETVRMVQWWGPDTMRVFTEDGSSRWNLLRVDPHSDKVSRWGESVHGVSTRLIPLKTRWSIDEPPGCDLLLHQIGFGELQLATVQMPASRLEVDGELYRHAGEEIVGAAYHRSLVWINSFHAHGPRVVLNDQWRSVNGNRPLRWTTGTHSVRYGWSGFHTHYSDPTRLDRERPIVVWTSAAEIEIGEPDETVADSSGESGDNRKRNAANVVVELTNAAGIQERPSFWIGRQRLTREMLLDRLGKLRDESPTLTVAIRHTASNEEEHLAWLKQSLTKLDIQVVSTDIQDLPHVFAYENAKFDGTIRGTVVDAHQPDANTKYRVMLWHRNWETMSGVNPSLVVGAGEAFEFRNLKPDNYEIRVHEWLPRGRVVHFSSNWTHVTATVEVEAGNVGEVQAVFGKDDTGRWNEAYTWGEAVDGVIMRVTQSKFRIAPGDTLDLRVAIYNGQKIDLETIIDHESWELEIDGHWVKPDRIASDNRTIGLLKSKEAQNDIGVWSTLCENMTEAIQNLPPGTHTLRVARLLNGQRRSPNDPRHLRLISQPVEIDVVPANTTTTRSGAPVTTLNESVDRVPLEAESLVVSDGIYRVRPSDSQEEGTRVRRSDADGTVVLMEQLTDQFGLATMESISNDNTRFRINLKAAGPFGEGEDRGHFALVVDGLCVMVKGHGDQDEQGRMEMSADVIGEKAANSMATRLGIKPRLRRHPGHEMSVLLIPKKGSFHPGQPVVLQLQIKNDGDVPFSFQDGGRQRGARNNQFEFTAHRGLGGAELPDTGDPTHFGGLSVLRTLQPGEVFEKQVDVTKWFDFSRPDHYIVTGRFRMELHDPDEKGHFVLWEDVAIAGCSASVELTDGIYRVRPSDSQEGGTRVSRDDADGTVVLMEQLTDQFGLATMESISNDNKRFRINLKAAGPFAEGEDQGHFALLVDNQCVMVSGHQDRDAQGLMEMSADVIGKKVVDRMATRLGIKPRLRRHPGHNMSVLLIPKEGSFQAGQPVVLQLQIKNDGDVPFSFRDGGRQRGARNNQFEFTAHRGLGGAELPDTGDPTHFGGKSVLRTLRPGEVFEKQVEVTKWFDFSRPDHYIVTGRFRMELHDPDEKGHFVLWEDVAIAGCSASVEE